jgi:hypothetical protein
MHPRDIYHTQLPPPSPADLRGYPDAWDGSALADPGPAPRHDSTRGASGLQCRSGQRGHLWPPHTPLHAPGTVRKPHFFVRGILDSSQRPQ